MIYNKVLYVADAVRKIQLFKDVPALNIEKPLKDFLAGAKFRDLKKKKKEGHDDTVSV